MEDSLQHGCCHGLGVALNSQLTRGDDNAKDEGCAMEALARMPESLDAAEAAPLMCAGVTTFNALRHSGAVPSDLVAIQGIGGLGHLGIQFAQKFGYMVAAIGRGPENSGLA